MVLRYYQNLLLINNKVYILQKDRYVQARDLERMRNYIEQKMKDAKPLSTPPPPVEEEDEQITDEPYRVKYK